MFDLIIVLLSIITCSVETEDALWPLTQGPPQVRIPVVPLQKSRGCNGRQNIQELICDRAVKTLSYSRRGKIPNCIAV